MEYMLLILDMVVFGGCFMVYDIYDGVEIGDKVYVMIIVIGDQVFVSM